MAPQFQIDFNWTHLKAKVVEVDKPSETLYTIGCRLMSPHAIFKSATTDETVGTGTFNCISINAGYKLHGREGTLKALKRFVTSYTHLSYNYSDTDLPVAMTWEASCGLLTWDFVCRDEQKCMVARLSAKNWSVTKLGNIEFFGDKANDQKAREEILVTSVTLLYCMLLRSSSIVSLLGAVLTRPGPLKQPQLEGKTLEDMDSEDGQSIAPVGKAKEVQARSFE